MKPRFCKQCGSQFQPFKSTDKWCSSQCFYVWTGQQEIDKKVKGMKKKLREGNIYKSLQTRINKIVRLIDRGHPCISSGRPYGTYTPHGGHLNSVGAHPSLRYNLLNIWAQSDEQNVYKSGNQLGYIDGLLQSFGGAITQQILDLPKTYPTLKLSKLEAKEAFNKAGLIIKALESREVYFTTEERISVRREFNQTLGIYK